MADLNAEEEALSAAVARIVEDTFARIGTSWSNDMRYPWELGFAASIFGKSSDGTPDYLRADPTTSPKPAPRPTSSGMCRVRHIWL